MNEVINYIELMRDFRISVAVWLAVLTIINFAVIGWLLHIIRKHLKIMFMNNQATMDINQATIDMNKAVMDIVDAYSVAYKSGENKIRLSLEGRENPDAASPAFYAHHRTKMAGKIIAQAQNRVDKSQSKVDEINQFISKRVQKSVAKKGLVKK